MNAEDTRMIKVFVAEYVEIANAAGEISEHLYSVWDQDAGRVIYERSQRLTAEMHENYERLRRCGGSLEE